MSYYYVYKITFDDGTFYIGSRKSKVPFEMDWKYLGSPKKHRHKWKNAKLKKILVDYYDSLEEARHAETEFILDAWEYCPEKCLNASLPSRKFNRESCVLGGKRAEKKKATIILENPSMNCKLLVYGIRPACRVLKLDYGGVCAVLRGERRHHKGWIASYEH
jgi:hypothetical protein